MRFKRPKLKFALDEGVPNSVGRVLQESGHKVYFLNKGDLVPRGASDKFSCAFAVTNSLILVAIEHDMRTIAKRNGASNSVYATLNLLHIGCSPVEAASWVQSAMSLIEHEWHISEGKSGRRLYVEIRHNLIRTIR